MKFQWVIFVVIKQRLFIIKWGNSTRVAVMLNELDATLISCSNAVGDYKQAARLDWFGIRGMSSHFCPAERDHPFAFADECSCSPVAAGERGLQRHRSACSSTRQVDPGSGETAGLLAGSSAVPGIRPNRLKALILVGDPNHAFALGV